MNVKCYIINLDRAKERWESTAAKFRALGFDVVRVPAIDGKTLTPPYPDFSPWRYFVCRGRPITSRKYACFMSHIKALKTFLETDEEYALICEDDVAPLPELPAVLDAAFEYADAWDFLRLNGIKPTRGLNFARLVGGYSLCSDVKTASGNGAKIVDRRAARLLVERTLPMRLPHDVTLFYDFPIGVREVTVQPFPIRLNDEFYLNSCIGTEPPPRGLGYALGRIFLTTPIRVFARTIRKVSRWSWAIRRYLKYRGDVRIEAAADSKTP